MTKSKIQYLIDTEKLDAVQEHLRAVTPASAKSAYYLLPLDGKTLLVAAHGAEALANALSGHPHASDHSVPEDEAQLDDSEWHARFDAYDRYRSQAHKLHLQEVHPPASQPGFTVTASTNDLSIDRRFTVSGAPLMESWAYGPFEPAEVNIWVHSSTGSNPRIGYRAYAWPVRERGDQRSQMFMGEKDAQGYLSGDAPEWLASMVHEMFSDLDVLQHNLASGTKSKQFPTQEQVEAAAEAMWDSAKPVRAGVRKNWIQILNDDQYNRHVQETRREAKVALEAASKINAEQ